MFFKQSPFILISLLATTWLLLRGLVYQFTRFWFFDIPFVYYSPIRFELNLADTAVIVFSIGEIAAMLALFRKKESLRFWGLPLLPVNFLLFYWLLGMVVWALASPPGIDY